MQTQLADWIRATPEGLEADAILRKCVHCGFCLATCPTYTLLGDELDSPRGRIYLMKQMLEGAPVTERTQVHLDRCLTCRSCETTCPSGVEYGRLVDIGRDLVERKVPRSTGERMRRWLLARTLPSRWLFGLALGLGRMFRGLLPEALAKKIPDARPEGEWPAARHPRRMLVLAGCVQPSMAPSINAATARVLDRLGISVTPAREAGCCGATEYHLNAQEAGLTRARRNIDAWWPAIEAGAEAIVLTASGCGAFVKEYGDLLRSDPAYADKARRVSTLARDLAEVIAAEPLDALADATQRRVAVHCPCTLQHAQRLGGAVESILRRLGFDLTNVADGHLCCGSAGTYSLTQPELATRLRDNRLDALEAARPDLIVTANIGCQTHLNGAGRTSVRHWIELVDNRLVN